MGTTENPAAGQVADYHQRENDPSELIFPLNQESRRRFTIVDGEKAFCKVAHAAADEQREHKRPQRHLKNT